MTGFQIVVADMAKESVTSYAAGVITLGGEIDGFNRFDEQVSDGATFVIGIKSAAGGRATALVGITFGTPNILTIFDYSDISLAQASIDNTCVVFGTSGFYDYKTPVVFRSSAPTEMQSQGALWMDTRNMELYVYYTDNTNAGWLSTRALAPPRTGGPGSFTTELQRVGGGIFDSATPTESTACKTGDLILLFAYRDGSTTLPTLGTGFTNIGSSAGNTNCIRACARVATADDETVPTFTNASWLMYHIFRGHRQEATAGGVADSIGANQGTNGSGTTVTVKGLTTTEASGGAIVVSACGHRSTDVNFGDIDDDRTLALYSDGANSSGGSWLSNRSVDDHSDGTLNVGGTASGWASYTVEVRVKPIVEQDFFAAGYNGYWYGLRFDGEKWTSPGRQGVRASLYASGTGDPNNGLTAKSMTGLAGVVLQNKNDNFVRCILDYRSAYNEYPVAVSGAIYADVDVSTGATSQSVNIYHMCVCTDTNTRYFTLMNIFRSEGDPFHAIATWTDDWSFNTETNGPT